MSHGSADGTAGGGILIGTYVRVDGSTDGPPNVPTKRSPICQEGNPTVVATQVPELSQLTLKNFSDGTTDDELNAFIAMIRPLLERVIAVFQGKGGQGKTSIATHTAALLAENEAAKAAQGQPHGRVLIIEMDLQGNTHSDLGTSEHPLNDGGEALSQSILFGAEPKIIRDVGGRQCLDMLPSGEELENLPAMIAGVTQRRGNAAWLSLAVLIARLVLENNYAWVILDCPPSSKEPQVLALTAARWALVPLSVADSGSIKGWEGVNRRFTNVRKWNPDLELLGSVLFAFEHKYYRNKTTGERRPVGAWVEARAKIQELLDEIPGNDAPVFNAVIRDARTVAKTCRDRGELSFEVAEATDGLKWWEKRRGGRGNILPTERAEQVGEDYLDLVAEIVARITAIEAEEAEEAEVLPA
ncbi:ParA family protein [Prauserella marina]|uniref:ParA family protein n=1 Tax=Prauserella marina TaxID=530584 RepID=UPI001639747C|nr:ParA family protein [Prauserella marina]